MNVQSKEDKVKVLIAGESWVTHSIHVKGFDSFTTSSYEEGVYWLRTALERGGHEIRFLPNHIVSREFPGSAAELSQYDVVIVSDCGSSTLLIHPDTFSKSEPTSDRLAAIHDYVANSDALLMIGGYLTFQGIDGKARYHGTLVEAALPVIMNATDDRVEIPQGKQPVVINPTHPVLTAIDSEWPFFLGYNKLVARPEADTLMQIDQDPFLVVWDYKQGRSAAFASDCGPHWGPPGFLHWAYHNRFWNQLIDWLGRA